MFRKIVSTVAALVTAATASLVAAQPAHAQSYCNIYPPARIGIWGPNQPIQVGFGEGCPLSGSVFATWDLTDAAQGPMLTAIYSNKNLGTTVHYSDTQPLGKKTWVATAGLSSLGGGILQNQPTSEIKLGAVAYVSAVRKGSYHEVTARAYHYSKYRQAVIGTGGRAGQLQYRPAGTTAWKVVGNIKLPSSGVWVGKTYSPGARDYRVVFGPMAEVWDVTTATIRAN